MPGSAHLDLAASQYPVHQLVGLVPGAKTPALRALAPLREHDRPKALPTGALEQHRNVLRGVLAITVHHDNRGAGPLLVDKRQAQRDGALMPDVAAQPQNLDGLQVRGPPGQCLWRQLTGTVVDQQNRDGHANTGRHRVKLLHQEARGFPVVVHRDANAQVFAGHGRLT